MQRSPNQATVCDAGHQNEGTLQVNLEFCTWAIGAFPQFWYDTLFIKADQGIHILQLKNDHQFSIFSELISTCFQN